MATLEENEEATKTLVSKPAGSVSEPKNDAVEEGGGLEGQNSAVVVVNRRLTVTETTVEMRYLDQNDQNGTEDTVTEKDNNSVSVERGEFNGNGISLVVDVKGSMDGVNDENDSETKFGKQAGEGSFAGNGVDPDEKFGRLDDSMLILGKKGNVTEEKRGESSVIENQGYAKNDDGGIAGDRKHEFSVGDFVWGKIKSHPWWPGQIYDPSDASEFASVFKQNDRLLVAYFGDGSCAWCIPSQLVPFTEHFEEMSKQSTSKSFVNAVDKAIEEIGRRAELKMTCSCVLEENHLGLTRPQAMNAGVRPGVLVPEGDIGRLATPKHEPAELLGHVKHLAQAGSIVDVLELVLVKSWLSAFYRVRKGSRLPIYHEPQLIEGLEDKSKNVVLNTNDFSVPIEVPIQGPIAEECPSSLKAGAGKGPMLLDEKLNQRRKHKSVAELMGEDKDVKPKRRKKSKSGEETPSTTVKKKKKDYSEAVNEKATLQASATGRKRGRKKKTEISTSPGTAINDGVQPEREVNKSPLSTKPKKNEDSGGNVSRERKKSKYLSPPYTTPAQKVGKSSSKREVETESEKITKVARVGEPMTKAAGQLIVSPPISKCNGAISDVKMSVGHPSGLEISGVSPRTVKLKEKKIIDSMDVNASVIEVLEEVQCAGVHLMSLKNSSIEMIKRFITAFRSSMYLNESNYKSYHKKKARRKRKSSVSESGNGGNDQNQANPGLPQPVSHNENIDRPKSRVTKLKKAARAAAANKKEVDKKASPVSLVVSFPPGAPLPSKDEIIKTFSKYGNLNEDETEVLRDSNCAQVAYKSISDAEEAFREAIKQSPFAAPNVSYTLRYSSASSRALESGQKISTSPKKRTLKNPVGSQPTDEEISQIGSIRQKITSLTSMLETCNGKVSSEEKSSLEGEIKSLLQKVSALAVQTSS